MIFFLSFGPFLVRFGPSLVRFFTICQILTLRENMGKKQIKKKFGCLDSFTIYLYLFNKYNLCNL